MPHRDRRRPAAPAPRRRTAGAASPPTNSRGTCDWVTGWLGDWLSEKSIFKKKDINLSIYQSASHSYSDLASSHIFSYFSSAFPLSISPLTLSRQEGHGSGHLQQLGEAQLCHICKALIRDDGWTMLVETRWILLESTVVDAPCRDHADFWGTLLLNCERGLRQFATKARLLAAVGCRCPRAVCARCESVTVYVCHASHYHIAHIGHSNHWNRHLSALRAKC